MKFLVLVLILSRATVAQAMVNPFLLSQGMHCAGELLLARDGWHRPKAADLANFSGTVPSSLWALFQDSKQYEIFGLRLESHMRMWLSDLTRMTDVYSELLDGSLLPSDFPDFEKVWRSPEELNSKARQLQDTLKTREPWKSTVFSTRFQPGKIGEENLEHLKTIRSQKAEKRFLDAHRLLYFFPSRDLAQQHGWHLIVWVWRLPPSSKTGG